MSNEYSKEISSIFDKIISKLINYYNAFNKDDDTNNQIILLDKLQSIYNFIKIKLSKDLNKNKISSENEKIYLITDANERIQNLREKEIFGFITKESSRNKNNITSYQYVINKLKREIKEQHEKYQIKELGYLDRISKLQKSLQIYEEYNNKINIDNNLRNINKPKIKYLLNSVDNKKTNSYIEIKDNQKYISHNKIKKLYKSRINNNKLSYQTFSDLKKKRKLKQIDFSNIDFNNDDSKPRYINKNNFEQNLFINKYLLSIKNIKVLKRNINTAVKHDFKEIKKEIDDSKKKIRLLKEC